MPIRKYTVEQIIGMLRETEILIADGDTNRNGFLSREELINRSEKTK